MKIVLTDKLLIYAGVIGSSLAGVLLIFVLVLVLDAWDMSLLGLVVSTVFFAFLGLWFDFLDGDWMPSHPVLMAIPFLVTAVFLGMLTISAIALITTAFIARFEFGALCVVMLVGLTPIGLIRESFRNMSDGKPSRPLHVVGWASACAVLDVLLYFRPDLLRIPAMV